MLIYFRNQKDNCILGFQGLAAGEKMSQIVNVHVIVNQEVIASNNKGTYIFYPSLFFVCMKRQLCMAGINCHIGMVKMLKPEVE